MKVTEMRCLDMMEWLKNREDDIIYEMSYYSSPGVSRALIDLEEELQLVREIKDVVGGYHEQAN